VRATAGSGRFACGFRTDLHFADVDTPPRHPHPREGEGAQLGHVKDLRQPDPGAKQVALDEFVLTQAILTRTHMGTHAFVRGMVRGVSNLTFE
jgi:hypothetical protein